ncbi:MAG: amidohydrolase family protein [Actinomycetia bacterium]|nr:amidohydrolase family protein [Actinomycetes bacterium]MCP4963103.1 amidohydrolase family protein [Actinomycetes bacterium]
MAETAIEPEIEIVDAHHHLWDHETPYGRYDLDELRADTGAGHNVVETVFIDCGSNYLTTGPESMRPVGETLFVTARADTSDRTPGAHISAIVSHVNLGLGQGAGDVLDAHIEAAGGRFRGIRHSGAISGTSEVVSSRGEPPADLYRRPAFQAGARELAARRLTFDAWQYHHQLGEVVALARAVPDLRIIVNHLGGPIGIGSWARRWDEVHADLRRHLGELAACENVWLKVGGIGMSRFGTGWDRTVEDPSSDTIVDMWDNTVRFAIDTFGPSRCMFESNYPVDGQTVGYVELWNAFKKMSARYTPDERSDLFAGTARRAYHIG